MRFDRRAAFFLVAAIACALMIPVSDADLRWVAELTSAVYVVLAIAAWLDSRSRRGSSRRGTR